MLYLKFISRIMKNTPFILYIIFVFEVFCHPSAQAQNPVASKFLYRQFQSDTRPFPYRLFVPDPYDENKKYPIVLTLHGSGESGTDNERHVNLNGVATCWAQTAFQNNHPCFIVSPQSTGGWGFASVMHMMDSLVREFSIDTNRIYITGLSMGGYGTWTYISEYPGYFAAAMPVCGGLSDYASKIPNMEHIPVWNHHGSNDAVVPTAFSRDIFLAYENAGLPVAYAGGKPDSIKKNLLKDKIDYIYTEYGGIAHDVWHTVYSDSLVLEWMFAQRKRTKGLIRFENTGAFGFSAGNQTLHLTCAIDSLDVVLSYSADFGYHWDSIAGFSSSKDSVTFASGHLSDSPRGQFRLQLLNKDKEIIGTDYSPRFVVDNAANFKPLFTYGYVDGRNTLIDGRLLKLIFNALDVENDSLELQIYYQQDDTLAQEHLQTLYLQNGVDEYITLDYTHLMYGRKSSLKFKLLDGEHEILKSTGYIHNNNNKVEWYQSLSQYTFTQETGFRAWPNPAKGYLNIDLGTVGQVGEYHATMTGINGKRVWQGRLQSPLTHISTENMCPGYYVVLIYSDIKGMHSRIPVIIAE
jgi:pimeloyl-ACP methyl ester carboxylesterase